MELKEIKWSNGRNLTDGLLAQMDRLKKERDAAIADLTELAYFIKRRTICDFCKHDRDDPDDCQGKRNPNEYINDCFEWRGI